MTIRNRSDGVVFDATGRGSIMLLALPPGQYTVNARHGEGREVLHADVERGKHTKLAFDWKDCATRASGC